LDLTRLQPNRTRTELIYELEVVRNKHQRGTAGDQLANAAQRPPREAQITNG
jgi:hypothetical protein